MVKNGPKTGKNGKFRSEKGLCGLEMHFCEKKFFAKIGQKWGGGGQKWAKMINFDSKMF